MLATCHSCKNVPVFRTSGASGFAEVKAKNFHFFTDWHKNYYRRIRWVRNVQSGLRWVFTASAVVLVRITLSSVCTQIWLVQKFFWLFLMTNCLKSPKSSQALGFAYPNSNKSCLCGYIWSMFLNYVSLKCRVCTPKCWYPNCCSFNQILP